MIPEPSLEHSFALTVELGAPIELGQGRAGKRRIIPIIGGSSGAMFIPVTIMRPSTQRPPTV